MKANIIHKVGNLTILEVQVGNIFEYYVRETDNEFDYFRFSFGSDQQLNKQELEKLMINGYFENTEE